MFTYIPGQSAVFLAKEEGNVAVFRSVMSDYGLVFLMTMISVIIIQIAAVAVNGPLRYISKFFNFGKIRDFFLSVTKGKFQPALLAQGFLDIFLGFMDLVGEIAKVFSLSFRLFGNMFAGEVLGAVTLFLAPFFMPLPFMFLGLLTAFVQAFVFSVLTLVFINMASESLDVVEA
jgi:F-type H+-transporting ATPase subunit a